MNARSLLDTLLSAGQSMAQQGKDIATDKLNIPTEDTERKAMLNGMGKGALAAGALALLLGTKTGRGVTGGALKVGSLAALGGLAYKAYQQWQDSNSDSTEKLAKAPIPHNLESLTDNDDARSQKLLQAIIAAAKADGHIDDNERQVINEFMQKLGESAELSDFIQRELDKPLDPAEIAKDTDKAGLAAEVYLMSKIIINEANFMEKSYLNELANALKLDKALIAQLDNQALQAA